MKKKIISSVLFDFDGVLIDSLPTMEIAWQTVKKRFNLKQDFHQYKRFIGLPFNRILFALKIDQILHEEIKETYAKVASENKKLIKLNPYVKEVLYWLSNNSISTGIVTSKDKLRTFELVEYFQLNIQAIITPELTKLGKPSSEPILYAANKLQVTTNEILFIGDMKSDMNTAKNSKCNYLHYLKGYQKLEVQAYGGQISSLIDIVEYIKNL